MQPVEIAGYNKRVNTFNTIYQINSLKSLYIIKELDWFAKKETL